MGRVDPVDGAEEDLNFIAVRLAMKRGRKFEREFTVLLDWQDFNRATNRPYFIGQLPLGSRVCIENLRYGKYDEVFFRTYEEAKQKLDTILEWRPDIKWLDVYVIAQNHFIEVLDKMPYEAEIRVHRISSPRPSG